MRGLYDTIISGGQKMIVSAVAVLGFPLAEVERLAVVTIMLVEDHIIVLA